MTSLTVARSGGVPAERLVDPDAEEFYATGSNRNCATKILVNHVGFAPSAGKFCVVVNPPEKEFVVHRHVLAEEKGRVFAEEFRGVLRDGGPEIGPGSTGEFSETRKEGLYYISCGKFRSRQFVVKRKIYDVPLRVMLNYFQMQHCGDSLGWAGPCHLDDGVVPGEGARDFSGGHHQSCDLRKWPCLLNLAYIGLVEFALRRSAPWDRGQIADEIRHGCEYYFKLVKEDGGLFDSVCIPLGWGAREFYASDAPAPALWNAVRHQALASRYFRGRDAELSRKCLATALAVWRHMIRPERPSEPYRAPKLPPRGHDRWNEFFAMFLPGAALDLAHRLCAAAELFRATGDAELLRDMEASATALASFQLQGGDEAPGAACFRNENARFRCAEANVYFWQSSGPQGLCDALELAPESPEAKRWEEAVRRIAKQSKEIAARNPYGRVPAAWSENAGANGLPSYFFYPYGYNMSLEAHALFLRRAGKLLREPELLKLAQRQIDHVLGANPLDVSSVEGVGYNQCEHVKTGEFIPPTPQIPGAVSTGAGSPGAEYDAPPTGWLMSLLADVDD